MKKILFKLFRNFGRLISGKGLANLPFSSKIYQTIYNFLKPNGVVTVKTEGHLLYINSNDSGLGPPLIMHGFFAPTETKVLRGLLKPGMVFVDIGANIGYFSLIAAKQVAESGKIFAFEPDEENFSLLKKNITLNRYTNIISVKKAVSEFTGYSSFYLRKDNLCAHSLIPDDNSNKVEVETITFDEYFKDKGHIDVIKIDVEGAEPKVLNGMKQTLSEQNKIALITEFFPEALVRSGINPEEYLRNLKLFGFSLFIMNEKQDEETLAPMDDNGIIRVSRGEKIEKLTNILCLKNWPIDEIIFKE